VIDLFRVAEDVEGVVLRQQTLDWGYIESQLRPLAEAKEVPHILDRLSQLRHREA